MLTLGHLYPDEMNLYGDRGNIIALCRRAEWRHIPMTVLPIGMGQTVEWESLDLLFMGGGEDRHQVDIAQDWQRHGPALLPRLEGGLPMLAVCGGYQLLGRYYTGSDGRHIPGLGFLDVYTEAGKRRQVGDVVATTQDMTLDIGTLVGFENHGGRTQLAPGVTPLARVLKGGGNNGDDQTEGAVRCHVIGTYLHGSLLPKNPLLADRLLGWALAYRGMSESLAPLSDTLEEAAHRQVVERELEKAAKAR